LKAALVEKNVLLREVHHRVKNNLAMMTSLVRIIGRTAPVDSQPYFRDIAQRITVVGKIYNQIHSAGDLSAFDAAAYLREVCGETVRALGSPVIRLRLDVAHMDIDVDTALPVGLIATELITNALKHAFEGRDRGELLVRAWQLDGTGFLTVADDGRGLPETIRSKAAGLGLAETLARQVDGTLKADARPCGGTEFNLSFRLNRRRRSADAA
jgi:two-component sensor histidine kinase